MLQWHSASSKYGGAIFCAQIEMYDAKLHLFDLLL